VRLETDRIHGERAMNVDWQEEARRPEGNSVEMPRYIAPQVEAVGYMTRIVEKSGQVDDEPESPLFG
jgi:hypothetical protein